MPRNENIGGFYYGLGVQTDRGSFARALEAITGIKAAWLAAAGAITGATLIAGKAMDSVKLAEHIGIGTSALDKWKTAAAMAKVNAGALLGEMANLNDKMVEFKKSGTIDRSLADNLGLLAQKSGVKSIGSYTAFAAMGAEERFRAVFAAASKLSDPQMARKFINDILGGNAASMHDFLRATGGSLEGLLGKASGLTFSNEQTKKDAAKAYSEIQGTIAAIKGIGAQIGEEAAKGLGVASAHINKWLADNHDEIQRVIGSAFNAIENTAKNIVGFFKSDSWDKIWTGMQDAWVIAKEAAKWIWDHTIGYTPPPVELSDSEKAEFLDEFNKSFGMLDDANIAAELHSLDSATAGLWLDALDQILDKDQAENIRRIYDATEAALAGAEDKIKDSYIDKYGAGMGRVRFYWDKLFKGRIQDGIISPGGGITQVDSNDWVLAFKNLEDVAGAFHAGDRSGGTANVTISQTFQIGGNVRDLPGTIREQAYKGTSSAIGEMFQNTAKIVQLMPATR